MEKNCFLEHWDGTASGGIAIQNKLRTNVIRRWEAAPVRNIGAADVHFPEKNTARAAIAVLSYPGLKIIDSSVSLMRCEIPYIPGLLSFREIPSIFRAWKGLKIIPDIMMCDSHGIAHPRRFGLACHLGLILHLPAIGCAKSHLYGDFAPPGEFKGDISPVRDKWGEIIGAAVRTRNGTRPVYVSVGHMIDLDKSIELTIASSPRYRIPEPLRAAHQLAAGDR
ncbi:MAG: endonuclease V [Candidatus Krumholzibacteriota bacterium]|nr:endonuclease V [Candidatus Krumholzibacteriota bacterium]